MTDIGNVISSGKLEVVDSPEGCPKFIGHVKIIGFGKTQFMFFKEHYFDRNGDLKFKDLVLNENESRPYRFDMCFMRIPSEFQYIAIDAKNVSHFEGNDQKVYGLTLLNIHIHITDPTEAKTPAQKTFIKVKTHYGLPFEDMESLIPPPAFFSGKMGCKSLGFSSIGSSQVPMFYGIRTINHVKIEQYFMLSLGTEATIGYCMFRNQSGLVEEIKHIADELQEDPHKEDPTKEYRLGIKLVNREYYEVSGFDNKYGVHMIDRVVKGDPSKKGWGVGWFEVISY